MNVINKFSNFLEHLEAKKFSHYMGIFFGIIILISGFIVYRYYQKTSSLRNEISEINDLRENEVVVILKDAERVRQERNAVNKMLEEDQDFKIGGFFKELINQLNLTSKITEEKTSQIRRDDEYQESVLDAHFSDISMKDLTELLYKIEQTRRVYPKNLEIVKSKKSARAIDVNLSIATLQKAEPLEI